MKELSKYGIHRVLEPIGSMPQAASKIDSTPVCYDNELLIDVDVLNIDSASFHQIKNACNHDPNKMKEMIMTIVKEHGKMQNPVTKSGGMLIGKVLKIGKDFHDQTLKKGDHLATLVSLSLTPLVIDEIIDINLDNDQVTIKGKAVLFDSGIYAVLPEDLDQRLALAVLDVAGAPAQVLKLAQPGQTVLIVGAAGKSGLLCSYQAKISVGRKGKVIGLVINEAERNLLLDNNLCDEVFISDATDAMDVYEKIVELTEGKLADLTINVVNVSNTEMGSILATKDEGIVYFFSMATSFTKAALGAEGIGKDVTMIIGNGYTYNHSEIALNIMRESKFLKQFFSKKYV
ncbi:MAG: L-erythro-3,5-diaminohexanoate dehydrogenase [Acholeplasmataceae bacterium]